MPLPDHEQAVHILQQAQLRILEGWCQRNLALNGRGKRVTTFDKNIARLSLMGAVHKEMQRVRWTSRKHDDRVFEMIVKALGRTCGGPDSRGGKLMPYMEPWLNWHDVKGRKVQEVVAKVDVAILDIKRQNGVVSNNEQGGRP